MIEFGNGLRAAREKKGYSIAQVAEMTKIMPSIVEGLEQEDFRKIVAPIYGRGFVRLYCQAVDLDPRPYIDEFMSILNGSHDTQIRERTNPAASSADEAAPAPVPDPVGDAPRTTPSLQTPENLGANPQTAEAEDNDGPSRYATPIRQPFPEGETPRVWWRIAVLGTVALALLWLLIAGLRVLHSATEDRQAAVQRMSAPSAKRAPAAQPPAKRTTAPAPANVSRTPQKIPSLYID